MPVLKSCSHVGDGGEAVGQQKFLRLGQRRVHFGGGRIGNPVLDQRHRRIDEQTVLDPPASGRLRLRRNSCGLERGTVDDPRMAIDTAKPHRPVADHDVEVGCGREALVGP